MSEEADPNHDVTERDGPEERDYLLGRAAAHRALAIDTGEAGAKSIHLRLAEAYAARAARLCLVDRD